MNDPSHKFKVGQVVELAPNALGRSGGEVEVTRLLPAVREDLEPQYRVKSRAESYERVVEESMIATAR